VIWTCPAAFSERQAQQAALRPCAAEPPHSCHQQEVKIPLEFALEEENFLGGLSHDDRDVEAALP
jgi:hypothetical protein